MSRVRDIYEAVRAELTEDEFLSGTSTLESTTNAAIHCLLDGGEYIIIIQHTDLGRPHGKPDRNEKGE